jgi:hypothetical protein
METEGEFRVIDPETGKPRAKGTEDWTDEEYGRWKKTPWFLRYNLTIPRIGWVTIALVAAGVAAAWFR